MGGVTVKFKPGLDRESSEFIRYELLKFIPQDFRILVDDVWLNLDFF